MIDDVDAYRHRTETQHDDTQSEFPFKDTHDLLEQLRAIKNNDVRTAVIALIASIVEAEKEG